MTRNCFHKKLWHRGLTRVLHDWTANHVQMEGVDSATAAGCSPEAALEQRSAALVGQLKQAKTIISTQHGLLRRAALDNMPARLVSHPRSPVRVCVSTHSRQYRQRRRTCRHSLRARACVRVCVCVRVCACA